MKSVLIFLGVLFSIGCSNHSSKDDYLSGEHKEFLGTIVDEFDQILLDETEASNTADAYLKFSESLKWNESSEEFEKKVERIQPQVHELLEKLNAYSDFESIWRLNHGISIDNREDTVSSMYDFNPLGDYLEYLHHRAERDTVFKDYAEIVSSTISIPPSLAAGLPHAIEHFDLSNREDRLIIAVHYITLLSRKEK